MNASDILLILIFVSSLVLVAGVSLVFAPAGPSDKRHKRRIIALRERFSTSDATRAAVQLRKILARRENKLDNVMGRFLPKPAELRLRLARTGKKWSVGQYGLACAIVFAASFFGLTLAGRLPVALAFMISAALAIFLPHMYLSIYLQRRVNKFITLFPDAIDLIVRSARSGLPVSEALVNVGREIADPIGHEFRLIVDKIRIGRSIDQALAEAAVRIPRPEVQFFVVTLNIQRETGGNLAETLANLSEVLRKRMQMKLKIKAMSSEAKASAWILGCLPFVMFVLLSFVNPEFMKPFHTDQRLQIIAAGGIVWLSIGVMVMAKMISFEI